MLVRQGVLSGGTVVVDNTNVDSALISYTARGDVAREQRVERQLDAAGRPVGDVRIVTTIEPRFDERGRVVGEWITNPRQGQAGEPAMIPLRRVEYFGDDAEIGSKGKIKSEIHYFGAGISAPNPPQGVDGLLTGRLSQVVQYTYDLEGRMTRQDRFGQPPMPVPPPPPPRSPEPSPEFPVVEPEDPNAWYEQDLAAWWDKLTRDGAVRRTADGASLANQLTLLSRTRYHFDDTLPAVPGYPNRDANGRLTRYANEVLALGFGEKASDHFDGNTGFRPYVQYHEIRGYAGTGGGWQEDWVVGNRVDGAYNADYRIGNPRNDNQGSLLRRLLDALRFADDPDTTVSRLFDAFGRVSDQYEYLDIPGTGRKNQHRVRGYAYNADGQVISRKDYSAVGADRRWAPETVMPERRFVISNGNQVAELTIGAPARNDDPAIEGLQQLAGSTPYRAGGGQVSVQGGDTLSSIAQRVYGNASYWYVLADANGVGSPDEALIPGTLLDVPSVGVSRNSADTFKPYDASEALGPSTPVLPYIAPSPNSCGVVGQLIMVVVAVIATIYTAGAAGAALGATTTGGFAGTLSTGLSVLGGTAGTATFGAGAAFTAGAIGGAVGSVASQAVGMATGNVQSFSWRGVATSALTAGAGAGLGTAATLGKFGSALAQGLKDGAGWAQFARGGISGLGSGIVGGAASDSFSWRQIGANVVGNAIGSSIGGAVGGALGKGVTSDVGKFAAQFAGSLTGGMVSQAISSRLATGTSRIDGVSAFGDALGSTLADRWASRAQTGAGAARAEAERNVPEWQREDALRRASMIEDEAIALGLGRPATRQLSDITLTEGTEGVATRTVYTDLDGRRRFGYEQAAANYLARDSRYRGVTESFSVADAKRAVTYALPSSDVVPIRPSAPSQGDLLRAVFMQWGRQRLDRIDGIANDFHVAQADALNRNEGSGALNALNYATTLLGKELVTGGTGTLRMFVDRQTQAQVTQGVTNLVTSPIDTLGAAWGEWLNLSDEQRLAKGGAGLVSMLSGAGAAAKIGPRYHIEFGSVEARGFGRNQVGSVATVRVISEAKLAERLIKLGGDEKYLTPEHQARIPRSSWTAGVRRLLGLAPDQMVSPHRHHILELNGQPGVHRALVREGQDILRSYKIDPVLGPENLIWAPNRGHGVGPTQSLVNELRAAAQAQASREYIEGILARHGRSAAGRGG